MAPPAKRRKRNVESSPHISENEDDPSVQEDKFQSQLGSLAHSPPPRLSSSEPVARPMSQSSNSTRSSLRKPPAKTASLPHNAAPVYLTNHSKKSNTKSPSTSPEKPKSKSKVEKKRKDADIHTFFTKQAQRQQAEGQTISKQRIKVLSSKDVRREADLIDDSISDDDDVEESRAQTISMVGQAAKRGVGKNVFTNSGTNTSSVSQRFVKPSQISSAEPAVEEEEEDMRTWAERFGPNNLEELGVHKKKVTDVRTWLENVIAGQMRQRLLILKGSAGTGKTTTVQLLAKDMGCDVLEWRNPVGSVASSDGFQSMAAQFEEFMGRGGKFGQLDLFSDNRDIPAKPEVKRLDQRKQIILVEEFPNTFTRSSSALQSFRSAILQYLASNTPPLSMQCNSEAKNYPITPVVMIISETLLTTTSAAADSFTAHRLLGEEILQHPGVRVMEFNAIAPTILAKALETVVQKESRKSGRRKTPGPQVLKTLGEVGDIRSAIGSLEFMCLRGDLDDWGGKVVFGKAKKASKDTSLTKMEEESLESITRREASLGIFHAIGKIVYNKREGKVPGEVESLPHFISHHSRSKKSEVNINNLIDETGTDTPTFIAALHENYILSCEAPPSSFEFSSLDHVNGCIDALSDSDLLCPSWDGSLQSSGFGGSLSGTGGDILRQDEMSFQTAVRGILFSLPHPVSRKAPSAAGFRTGKAADAHRMFYPTSLKLWRMKEGMESTLDLWVTRLMRGEIDLTPANSTSITSGAAAFARPKTGTVESWKIRNSAPASAPSQSKTTPQPQKEEDTPPLLTLGVSARTEMLLERLPYMVQISKSKSRNTPPSSSSSFSSSSYFSSSNSNHLLKSLEKITTFTGIGLQQINDEAASCDDDSELNEQKTVNWATDKPDGMGTPRKKKRVGLVMKKGTGGERAMPVQQPEQKFVLSDDDIEDD
ncbi:hypothetical protein DSL72_005758 [Monilinia vaccinii-corymbosi]|uniref:Checkpoint protein RAD24-like helical bundle domain-containing protein n=1 Tax=Monilinia vaccinii-corymbosi TaxID=61207 RepID=A0A8A3PGH8_9HELO|nr:hypothetical protein DSL72_005758 [Monilinia vaccinii-corymbosi]